MDWGEVWTFGLIASVAGCCGSGLYSCSHKVDDSEYNAAQEFVRKVRNRVSEEKRILKIAEEEKKKKDGSQRKITDFVMVEQPALYGEYQELTARIESMNLCLSQLRQDYRMLGRNYADDPDVQRSERMCQDLVCDKARLWAQMQKIYVMAKQAEVMGTASRMESLHKDAQDPERIPIIRMNNGK